MSSINNTDDAFFFAYLDEFLPRQKGARVRNDTIKNYNAFLALRLRQSLEMIPKLINDLARCCWEPKVDLRNCWVGWNVRKVGSSVMN